MQNILFPVISEALSKHKAFDWLFRNTALKHLFLLRKLKAHYLSKLSDFNGSLFTDLTVGLFHLYGVWFIIILIMRNGSSTA